MAAYLVYPQEWRYNMHFLGETANVIDHIMDVPLDPLDQVIHTAARMKETGWTK